MNIEHALDLVQRDPHAAPMAAWRLLAQHARRCARGDEDVVQEVLMVVLEHRGPVEKPGSWLGTVARNELRDRHSRGRVDVQDVEIPSEAMLSDEARARVAATLSGLDAAIAHLRTSSINGRRQMRATLHRALGAGRLEVRDEASLPCGISDDLVSKWIERGREPLLALIEAIEERVPDEDEILPTLRLIVAARRSDAGQPRPARRRAA